MSWHRREAANGLSFAMFTLMCIKGKQRVNHKISTMALAMLGMTVFGVPVAAMEPLEQPQPDTSKPDTYHPDSAGGVMVGDNIGGLVDRSFVSAPPGWSYVVSLTPGHFLDCGQGVEVRKTDSDGRDQIPMSCGVSLTETLKLPSVGSPAELTIHF